MSKIAIFLRLDWGCWGMPDKNLYAKPFLRWAGGKTWLTKYLNMIIGDLEFKNYFEPFLGGGAVFFQLQIKNASFLSDLNAELINTYIRKRFKVHRLFCSLWS